MKILKGFINIQQLLSNIPGTISPIGEISPWSLTYTKELGEYINPAINGYRLITFRSVDPDVGNIQVSSEIVNLVIEISRSLMLYATTHQRPYIVTEFIDTMLADYYGLVYDLDFGPFVDNGGLAMPQWITFKTTGANQTDIKLWFADAAFADQFDEYEIVVVPPITILDNFFQSPMMVKNEINARTVPEMMEIIQEAKGNSPETYLRSFNFEYNNPTMPSIVVNTYWNVLVYGKQGDNLDAIKDAIIDYVLANSTKTRQEWLVILPELFKRTEFIILPRWDIYSILNLAVAGGLYRSMIQASEAISFAKAKIDFYDDTFIEDNTIIVPYDYKGITLEIINGAGNIEGKQDIRTLFPDYVPLSSTTLDFNRMSISTQNWILMLSEMLIVCETVNKYSAIPHNMRKIYRGDMLYLTSIYDNVNYLMAAKINYGS